MSDTHFAQFVNPGCSSLIKTPLYFTLGAPWTFLPSLAHTPLLLLTGTSAHQYHGLTPIPSLTSYRPYTVPLRSLPAMTSALSTPGNGEVMTWEMKDSHFPEMGETSNLPVEIRCVIREDFPIVPAMRTVFEGVGERSVGPVKFWEGPSVYYSYVDVSHPSISIFLPLLPDPSFPPHPISLALLFQVVGKCVSRVGNSHSQNWLQAETYNTPSSHPSSPHHQ